MELFEAIRRRKSCRSFLPDIIPNEEILKVMEAGTMAPSPANNQPWEFIVITKPETKAAIAQAADATRKMLFEKSGWKWLERYSIDFLNEAPVLIVVAGEPVKSGAHIFLEDSIPGYQHACAAAVENMLLAASAMGLGSLWFTLFQKQPLREILGLKFEIDPLSIICLGKPAADSPKTTRKSVEEKTRYIK